MLSNMLMTGNVRSLNGKGGDVCEDASNDPNAGRCHANTIHDPTATSDVRSLNTKDNSD